LLLSTGTFLLGFKTRRNYGRSSRATQLGGAGIAERFDLRGLNERDMIEEEEPRAEELAAAERLYG